ncbi:phage tail tape measure protein [Raoultella planticola]|uniref:phage tail tape measure protein n=1 Tax=Raoultella planticola TaxID=575 RepID=UPI00349F6283
MAEGEKAGGIYIEIEAETANLIDGQRKANQALDNIGSNAQKTSGQFKRLDTQLNATSKVMSSGLRGSVQQAGYQIQDFIVQVQGGQSALVAFSQQGSQLAGAFGPGGAVVGALIALGTVVAGTLISSLNGGKSAMDALKDAAERMNDVISVSSQGIAALSDKYANLARVNATVATLLRNQALLEYNQAISKIPKAISDASDSFITLGDRAIAAVGGASPSIKKFNDELSALGVTTTDWGEAIQQANSQGQYASGIVNSLSSTVSTLSSRLGISKQSAFDLARELSNLSNNPSPEALQELAKKLQEMKSSSTDGQSAIADLAGSLVLLAREAANAKINVDSLNKSTDNLTAGQKSLIQQSERNLALSKEQGAARARLAAQYAAEDAGFSKDDPYTLRMMNEAAATYTNLDSQKKLSAEQKKGANQAESIAQKLANLKQQSELAAGSSQELSREQAILNAQLSLGKGATQEQVTLAGQYAAKKWDTANAIRAQAAAEKLLPEARENASYTQDVKDLQTALAAKKITQQQYDKTSEQLEAQHQVNLAKIRSQQAVTPQQQAAGDVDPVQSLANQHTQQLELIQQYEQQGVIAHNQALMLKNAADTQYEKARADAQWALFTQQSVGYEALGAAVDAFGSQASNALTGVITGSMSANDALRSIGNTILNDVINTFVQMGIQQAKSAIMGATAQNAAIATTTAAQVSSLATTTAASTSSAAATTAAWTPAALVASIGSFGGAVAIGLGALIAALAVGSSLAGKRKNGGPVSAGSMYQVGEGGMPEIYKASNGSQYMIPGDNGSVISNKDLRGSGGAGSLQVTNNVYNYASGVQVDTRSSQNGSEVLIETFISDLQSGGPMSGQMESTYGLRRQASGDY